MKYYKLLNNDEYLGIASSDNFFIYTLNHFVRADENKGEFVLLNNQFYRDYWMAPAPLDFPYYTNITIREITKDIYDAIVDALHKENDFSEIIQEIRQEVIEEPVLTISLPRTAENIDYLKQTYITMFSHECRKTIEEGFDMELRGETKHFSLDTQDQLNLMSLSMLAQTQETIPYHADGEICEFYTAAEINEIVAKANAFKMYQTTYFNALKAYINSLDDAAAIIAIKYGDEIPEEFKTDVLKALEGE